MPFNIFAFSMDRDFNKAATMDADVSACSPPLYSVSFSPTLTTPSKVSARMTVMSGLDLTAFANIAPVPPRQTPTSRISPSIFMACLASVQSS